MNKEKILRRCEMAEYDGLGTVYSIKDFIADVECGCLIDYDGVGNLLLGNMEVVNSHTYISQKCICIAGVGPILFDDIPKVFGKDAKICWYNK